MHTTELQSVEGRHGRARPYSNALFRRAQREDKWRRRLFNARGQLLAILPADRHPEIERAFAERMAEGPPRRLPGSLNVPPSHNYLNGQERAALMKFARQIERHSHAKAKADAQAEKIAEGRDKARPVHRGALGGVGLAILEALLFRIPRRDGGIYPALATIADLVCKSVPTVVAAIARLVAADFLTVLHRCKMIDASSPFGAHLVQDSNSYLVHAPTGLGELGNAAFASDLKNQPRDTKPTSKKEKSNKESSDALSRNFRAMLDAFGRAETARTGQGVLFDNHDDALALSRLRKGATL